MRNITATREAYNITTDGDGALRALHRELATGRQRPAVDHERDAGQRPHPRPQRASRALFNKFQQLGGNVYGFAPSSTSTGTRSTARSTTTSSACVNSTGANLSGEQTNWINEHTNFTHGYGFVAAVANSNITDTGNQAGQFTEGGIPQTGPLHLSNPAVYYGELMPELLDRRARRAVPQEFDQQRQGEGHVRRRRGRVARQLLQSPRLRDQLQADQLPAQRRGECERREDHLQSRPPGDGAEGRAVPEGGRRPVPDRGPELRAHRVDGRRLHDARELPVLVSGSRFPI